MHERNRTKRRLVADKGAPAVIGRGGKVRAPLVGSLLILYRGAEQDIRERPFPFGDVD